MSGTRFGAESTYSFLSHFWAKRCYFIKPLGRKIKKNKVICRRARATSHQRSSGHELQQLKFPGDSESELVKNFRVYRI